MGLLKFRYRNLATNFKDLKPDLRFNLSLTAQIWHVPDPLVVASLGKASTENIASMKI